MNLHLRTLEFIQLFADGSLGKTKKHSYYGALKAHTALIFLIKA